MSNSPLIDGVLLTDNYSSPRKHKIDRITPHYMAWYTDGRTCCESFLPASRKASANYCIGKDGDIWLNVEEKNRAWTSSSSYNDNRAITIECANYMDADRYGMLPDKTWDSLVRLCVDICQRNDIPYINYTGDDNGNLTKHKWYGSTDCPGPWFDNHFNDLAEQINRALNIEPTPTPTPTGFGGLYRCTVDGLRVRTQPNLNGTVVASYNMGELVELEDWTTENNGYVWGRYIGSTSGKLRYVAVGKPTGKVEPDDFLIKI